MSEGEGRTVPAVHGNQVVNPDPDEIALAEELRRSRLSMPSAPATKRRAFVARHGERSRGGSDMECG